MVTVPLSQELQAQLEEEVRSHDECREEQAAMERRCALLAGEGQEARAALENAERSRKALETELQEANEKYGDLNNQVTRSAFFRFETSPAKTRQKTDDPSLSRLQFQTALSGRRKLEVDLQTLQQEHEELQGELRKSTDKTKKASCEVEVDLRSLRRYSSRDVSTRSGFQ